MKNLVFALFSSFFLLFAGVGSVRAYESWSENFFKHVEREYGAEAAERLHFLQDFIIENQDLSVMEKLERVNNTMNRLPGIADSQHWQSVDYWATPLETITTFGGDCEDIAIVKWLVLNHLGIPNDNLRLAYVRVKKTNGAHMVLVYLEDPEAPSQGDVYVLDNNMQEVKPSYERSDLLAVHLIDVDGNVTLIADNGSERSLKDVLERREIRQLADFKEKFYEERAKYQEINDGRPFLPPSY